jgi:hypothetical protein
MGEKEPKNPERKSESPSQMAILERASSLINEAMFTITLQRRRLRSKEPEDEVFILRWWADLQFLIIALRRLRRAAEISSQVPTNTTELSAAIKKFDSALPFLLTMRNVGEHIDSYAVDSPKRRHKEINRRMLQVGEWDGTTYRWLGKSLNIDDAHFAAERLYVAVRDAFKNFSVKSGES